ncbi:uncharacterized protein LOC131294982 [Anopheles ziemanni]|uniref:uncharacterized protein LOC131263493 n=1 Tax=Anopheles coustani TaxID=139045 RepID=UPI002658AB27|nr:uncharacterized protein LOC131263493 [Anopheles coustani]XP_058179021.1 uncharacterized protein LOC131294982 [Anopheles ziemanni]
MVNHFHETRISPAQERPKPLSRIRLLRWDKLHQLQWVRLRSRSIIPPHAFEIERRGKTKLYLARAEYQGSMTPGYFDASEKKFFIVWGGKGHAKECGEILCIPGEFVPFSDSNTLLRATPAGLSEQGEPLHFGRVKHNGQVYYGKVQRSHDRVCYVSIDGKERAFVEYDVFVGSTVHPEVTNPANLIVPPSTSGWVHYIFDNVPQNAVPAVSSTSEKILYIGRTNLHRRIVPGVIDPSKRTCTIVWDGRVWPKREFEVLINVNGRFVPVQNNEIPPNAFPAGQSEAGETLYIGRVILAGSTLVGNVHPSHRCCYVSDKGDAMGFLDYEIFVC